MPSSSTSSESSSSSIHAHDDGATGGTITEVGGYRYHTFTSDGTFTPNFSGDIEYMTSLQVADNSVESNN